MKSKRATENSAAAVGAPNKSAKPANSAKSGETTDSVLRELAAVEKRVWSEDPSMRLTREVTLKMNFDKGVYPYDTAMSRAEYEAAKAVLQTELLKVQRWVTDRKERIVGLFEGRDAAGKGGTIKRFMEHLNPRTAHVVALEKPTKAEMGQWYFQRYIEHLPTAGEMAFFDRSWYNRSGVEKVMGFCRSTQYSQFLKQCPLVEAMLVESGITLFKYWFSVSRIEQLRRFYARKKDPLKQWKLSPVDLMSLHKWDDYTEAKKAMFYHTDTPQAPWVVIKSDDKKRARINCMRHFLDSLAYADKDEEAVGKPDPKIVTSALPFFDSDEPPLEEGGVRCL